MVYPGIFGLKEIIVGGQGCLMLSGGHQITGIYNQKGDLSPQQLKELGSAGPDYHFSEFYRYTDWIESCHALGLKVNVWTVNKKEDMQYFWDKVDFITTDEPLGLLKDIMKVK